MNITTPLEALAVLALLWGTGVAILAIHELVWTLKFRKREITRLGKIVRELQAEQESRDYHLELIRR